MNATATAKPYTQEDADLIKEAMKATGITAEMVCKMFPARPTTHAEAGAIWSWIVSQGGSTVAADKPLATSPASLAQAKDEAQANWARKDKNGKNMPQYFAVELADKPHFFRVTPGYKKGVWFVKEQASDELYPVGAARREQVMALILADMDKARTLYGQLISRCSRCNRTLTDHDNPYFPMYGPECGGK